MAMVVKNNMSAVSTLNTLNKNSNALQKSLSKVSSGMKINSAQDDASGYAISEKMRVQIRSLDQANQNTQNGSSMMKTAEGAVSSTVEILKSLKEKAINAANDTNKDSDRVTIQKEIDQFIDQIDDNALVTFNGKYLVDGSKAQEGAATYTKLTNQSLATDTQGGTALTELKNRNDESLEIAKTDYVTASYVKNGETFTTKFQVGTNSLEDVFKNLDDHNANNDKVFARTDGSTPAATPAATPVAAGGGNGTTQTTAQIQAMSESDLLAAAQGGVNEDLATTKADATSTAATDLATAVTNAVKALTDKLTTTNVDSRDDLTYKDADGNTQTITANTHADNQSARDALAAAVATELQTAAETAVSTSGGTLDDAKDAINTILDSITDRGTAITAMASTSNATEVSALATAVLQQQALANATSAGGGNGGAGVTINEQASVVQTGSQIGQNAAGDAVYTADKTEGLTISSKGTGIENMIGGVTISITDSQGNVKKAANASLDNFTTSIYAKNKSSANELSFQVGANANQAIAVGLEDMRSEALGLKSSDGVKVSVATQDKANAAIAVFDNAINKALDQQTTIGSIEARLEYTSSNLTTSSENVQAAESTIRDADMAKEMTNYTKNNVLLQAAQSMLAQANQSSSAVLSLLQ